MSEEKLIKVERIHATKGTGSTKAFCDISIGGVFVVKGLRVVEGKDGLFVGMPQEKGKNGKWYDTFFPTSGEVKKELQELVLEEFQTEHGER
jgi:stage V sporulation protein G